MSEQKIAPVLSEPELKEILNANYLAATRAGRHYYEADLRLTDAMTVQQSVLARVGAVRDQALEEAAVACETIYPTMRSGWAKMDQAVNAIRALKDTPAAAVADGNDLRQPLRQHVAWIHSVMRETGHCIDGGVCHHNCRPKPEAPCFRQKGCLPLTGSRLNDDWTLPAPQSSGNPGPLAAVEPTGNAGELGEDQISAIIQKTHDNSMYGRDHNGWEHSLVRAGFRAAIAASKEGASHG